MAAEDRDLNRDPLTDEPGSHPVGTGVGAASGAVAGATVGAVGGPIGMAVGGVVGAVVGGLAGKAVAEAVDPTAEEAHWRDNYTNEPYYEQGRSFDDYGPAYRHGLEGRTRHQDSWDVAEPRLASEWETTRGNSSLSWAEAQPASRAAWDRVENLRSPSASMGVTSGSGVSGSAMGSSTTGAGGVAAAVGGAQSAGDNTGDREDIKDVLEDLLECSRDGEYGFQQCADQAKREDLKSIFLQRADDCRRGAQQLQEQLRMLGGDVDEGGSVLGAVHRGWVSVKTALSTYDDKAVLEEAERGEDNALARYRKAMQKPLPAQVKQVVEQQMQGVQRNHDQIKMLRNQFRAA